MLATLLLLMTALLWTEISAETKPSATFARTRAIIAAHRPLLGVDWPPRTAKPERSPSKVSKEQTGECMRKFTFPAETTNDATASEDNLRAALNEWRAQLGQPPLEPATDELQQIAHSLAKKQFGEMNRQLNGDLFTKEGITGSVLVMMRDFSRKLTAWYRIFSRNKMHKNAIIPLADVSTRRNHKSPPGNNKEQKHVEMQIRGIED